MGEEKGKRGTKNEKQGEMRKKQEREEEAVKERVMFPEYQVLPTKIWAGTGPEKRKISKFLQNMYGCHLDKNSFLFHVEYQRVMPCFTNFPTELF